MRILIGKEYLYDKGKSNIMLTWTYIYYLYYTLNNETPTNKGANPNKLKLSKIGNRTCRGPISLT